MKMPATTKRFRSSTSPAVFAGMCLVLGLLVLATSCTNLFAPASSSTGSTNDVASVTDTATLISMGNSAIDKSDYTRALACFDRAIALNPRLSQARLGAVRAVMLRDDPLSFAALDTLMASLSGGNLSGLGTFAAGLNANALYASNGAPAMVQWYLRDTNGYSWWAGQCDGLVPTNSLTALVNLLFASVIELPAVLFDMHRDFDYNNTTSVTNAGDLLVYAGGALGINPTFYSLTNGFVAVASNLASMTNAATVVALTNATNVTNLSNLTILSNLSNTNLSASPMAGMLPSLLATDDALRDIHLATMNLVASIKTVDIPGRMATLTEISARFGTVEGAGTITNLLSSVLALTSMVGAITNDTNVGAVLGGSLFNTIHAALDGSNAFSPAAGLSAFTPWTWVPLSNASVLPSTNSLQGQLKILWTNFGFP